ncbi:unnamed protein product [Adineta steineri]|uniref:Maltokinase N-terminal cap domain-containing protein n=1 Tax=Adineta steineri TaxID=433720 RepID=A0A819C738_9BILA|nr:unnamed protein product [Adineta steineri]
MDSQVDNNQQLTLIKLQQWNDIVEDKEIKGKLQNEILPNYVTKMRWFGGKGHALKSIQIIDYVILPFTDLDSAYHLLLEISYHDGSPDIYHLPIAYSPIDVSSELQKNYSQSIISLINIDNKEGLLYDALYDRRSQQALATNLANNCTIKQKSGELVFTSTPNLKRYVHEQLNSTSKILITEESNTSIIYDQDFFLKIYRNVDRSINSDVEINQFLNNETTFRHIPKYVGSIQRQFGKETIVLGMIQEYISCISDGWIYILERLDDFSLNILSHTDITSINKELRGSLTNPLDYEEIPEDLKKLFDKTTSKLISLLGHRTGQMHQALSSNNELSSFYPEKYSVDDQHSLFSSIHSLIETVFQNLKENLQKLPEDVQEEAKEILSMKNELIRILERISSREINVTKTRIHGDYHLAQVLFTGDNFLIVDFEGEPAIHFTERRAKHSPLKDVAGMIHSFHYAAYRSLFLNPQRKSEDINTLLPFIQLWFHYISGFFIKSYLDTTKDAPFIPNNKQDIQILLETFLLQKAVYELNYELNYRLDWIIVPLKGIKSIIEQNRLGQIC